MRIPRSLQLIEESAYVSITWKCHNNAHLLNSSLSKALYLKSIKKTLKNSHIQNNIKVLSFCLMDNHVHLLIHYKNGSQNLSKFLRSCHSRFGLCFNRIHERSGKVANERPYSSLIEDFNHVMKVHLYIEANPIKANMYSFKNLKNFKFSTFRLFAYGIVDEYNDFISLPSWYLALGRTPAERQRRFRKIFLDYISNFKQTIDLFKLKFIGTAVWQNKYKGFVNLLMASRNYNSS